MKRPGDTIAERLYLDAVPDATPVVRVFRNGIRTATVVLTGVTTSYLVSYLLPSGWATTDFVQVIAYPRFGGVQRATEVWAGRLGSVVYNTAPPVIAALVCDVVPDSTPAVRTWLNGVVSVTPSIAAGADTAEFAIAVDPTGLEAGSLRLDATATFGGEPFTTDVWTLDVVDAAGTVPAAFAGIWYAHAATEADLESNTLYKRDGDSNLALAMACGNLPEIRAGETISSVGVPTVSGLTMTGVSFDDDTAWAVFSGGTVDTSYDVTWTITLSGGQVYERTGVLSVT